MTRRRDERGAVAMELVVLVPMLMMVLGVMTAGWRLWTARTQVSDAAAAAARAATLEASGQAAAERARLVARADLETVKAECDPSSVDVDTSAFATPPGQPGKVRVDVTCRVRLSDLIAPGLPGSWQVQANREHSLDTFRERRP